MPAGMSKAKARQNSKTRNSPRRGANYAAKAGKRRPHNIRKDEQGNYWAAEYKARPSTKEPEGRRPFCMDYDVPKNPPGWVDFKGMEETSRIINT